MSTQKSGASVLSIRTSSSSSSSSSFSTATSPTSSSAEPEYEADDEGNMSMTDHNHSRPLTVSIPRGYASGQYCNRRPNLSEILANTAPPPWTLSAFMAYMSQNHCLETLEFTMDASRYRKHYSKMVGRSPGASISPHNEECNYIKMLWKRLLDAYIAPNGPREVNLPSNVRDSLLALSDPYLPPHPSTLDPAVSKIYELMEESVLVPFLNSVCPQSAVDPGYQHHDEVLQRSQTRSYDDRPSYISNHPPHHPPHQRASAPSSLTSNFVHPRPFSHSRFASQPSTISSSSSPSTRMTPGYTSGSDALTDDSGSGSGSPSGLDDPMTPPNTPPMSEFNHYPSYYENGSTHSGTPSPRTSRGEHNGLAGATKDGWKRVSSKLWPRKRSGGALREEEHGAVEGGLF